MALEASMFANSYKYYLYLLKKEAGNVPWQKIFLSITAVLVIIFGMVSSVIFYQYQKDEPLREEVRYLQKAAASFSAASSSIEEILSISRIAGAKTEFISNTQEATAQAEGFFISLDDLERSQQVVSAAKNNINFQKTLLNDDQIPAKYLSLKKDLLEFYDEANAEVEKLAGDLEFAAKLLTVVGPNFYLPVLTNDSLWQLQDPQRVMSYYENTKKQADITLAGLAKITIPQKFKTFSDLYISYLERVVAVADNIIVVLREPESEEGEEANQLERAYQILVGATRENEEFSQKIASERLKLFDAKENLERFAAVNLAKNSLAEKIGDIQTMQAQPSLYRFFRFGGFTN